MSPVYQLDVCRHEVRYGCVREDDCFYAHSLVELKVWMLQQQRGKNTCTEEKPKKKFNKWIFCNRCDFLIFLLYCSLKGISQEGIVQEAKTFWNAPDLPQAATVMLRFISTLSFMFCMALQFGLDEYKTRYHFAFWIRLIQTKNLKTHDSKLIFRSTFHLQLSNARRRFGPPNLKLMFVCGQCQKNGQVSEADKNRKYCSAKARHP